MKIYTRTGDTGETGLFGGGRVPKDAARIEAYGSVDELNACLGVARAHIRADHRLASVAGLLEAIQSELFILGADLATPSDTRARPPRIDASHVAALERLIDAHEEPLPPLKNFVLPAGNLASASLHLARTVARRAERTVVHLSHSDETSPATLIYLNRLSDLLFVLARWCNHATGESDELWNSPA